MEQMLHAKCFFSLTHLPVKTMFYLLKRSELKTAIYAF